MSENTTPTHKKRGCAKLIIIGGILVIIFLLCVIVVICYVVSTQGVNVTVNGTSQGNMNISQLICLPFTSFLGEIFKFK